METTNANNGDVNMYRVTICDKNGNDIFDVRGTVASWELVPCYTGVHYTESQALALAKELGKLYTTIGGRSVAIWSV